jgi:hypothetical protein
MNPAPEPTSEMAPPPASRLWWMVPAAAFLLLVVVAMIIGPPPDPGGKGTSYDASDAGFRAAYLIIEELKYPVERSRLAAGGTVRWVLDPTDVREQDVANLDAWVQRGGVALLAIDNAEIATRLGLKLQSKAGGDVVSVDGLDVHSLDVGANCVDLVGQPGTPWDGVREGQKSLVTIVPRGSGEIWFLHRPGVLRNGPMRRADNAIFASRLADAMLADRPGRLVFDEYCHGLRDRPTVAALLFRPPMLAITIQALGLTMLILWSVAPRFGPIRPTPPPHRRSKEEFLDAIAELLRRKGDYTDAYRTVQLDLRRRIEATLGCPADIPADELAREVERRRGLSAERVRDMLNAPGTARDAEATPLAGPTAFVAALHQLDTLRHEFSDRRR